MLLKLLLIQEPILSKPLKEYVQPVLGEHGRGEKIRLSFERANTKVTALAASATWRRKGTRRGLFWEAAVENLIDLTQDDPDLSIVEHNDTISFIFEKDVLVRLKKADYSLHSSNYPTPTAELFHEHDADLFGFSGLQRVEAVYVPNRFDTDVLWTGIVARDGKTELWHFELAEPVAVSPVMLPAIPPTPAADLVTVKNQAKKANRKQDKDGRQ